MSRQTAALGARVILLLALAACSSPSVSPSPSASLSPTATPVPSRPDGLPVGELTRIDMSVEIAADDRTVTIHFIGGPELPPDTPCYTAYAGWAKPDGDLLEVALVQVVFLHPPPGSACAAIGVVREVDVVLDAPFLGTTAQDVYDGHTLEVERQ